MKLLVKIFSSVGNPMQKYEVGSVMETDERNAARLISAGSGELVADNSENRAKIINHPAILAATTPQAMLAQIKLKHPHLTEKEINQMWESIKSEEEKTFTVLKKIDAKRSRKKHGKN